tara:strand:+ start:18 stop:392 length:375 start_codon:yes stop_codon:yes gene_type:complete
MRLYKILAENMTDFFGTPKDRIPRPGITMIAQTQTCNAFLFLSKDEQTIVPGLEICYTVPVGFDFTYCQEWGLVINDAVVNRVIADLRKKSYGNWEDQLAEIYDNGIDSWKARILQVKQNIPKR